MKKVSFVLYFPYQWFIYKNIYNKIPAGQREVIIDMNANSGLQDNKVKESIISLLERENVFFRVLERMDYFRSDYFQEFFSDVEVLVSCWENGCVSHEFTKHIKKVNTTYGIGKELTMLRPTRSIYDVILAYGKRDQKYFELLTKTISVGNPRLDDYYRGKFDISLQEKLSAYFDDTKKKTILYVPTHGDLGSFHEMFPVLKKLSKKYNIVFKPHYHTLTDERDLVEKYRQIEQLLVIDDTWDTIETMALSDIVISDNSSSIFDAMQVDKPIIVCDFLNKHFLDVTHKNILLRGVKVTGALTFSDSFEQEIKNKDLVATIKRPNDLESLLENLEEVDKKYGKFRKEIAEKNFEYRDGTSGQRAADIIMQVYTEERKHVPGILHHAYLAFNNRVYRSIIESAEKKKLSDSYEKKCLVWIYCDSFSKQNEILGTLHLALSQKEVGRVCVSGIEKGMVKTLSENEFSDKICYFENQADGLRYVYSQLSLFDNLLFVKPNTFLSELHSILNFKISCNRDILFFSENVNFNQENPMSDLFYLLKYEILGFRSLAKNVLISVSLDQILVLEKSAVLADSKKLLEHSAPLSHSLSFEGIVSFFLKIDSLKTDERYGRPINDFVLMPNFFLNIFETPSVDIYKKLVNKGLNLYFLGVPPKKWPDNKIRKFLIEFLMGNFQYYGILKLVFIKKMSIKKFVLFSRVTEFLNSIKKG